MDPSFCTRRFEFDVNMIIQESIESPESNSYPAAEHKSPNNSATRVSTGRIRSNTKDPFPLLSEPLSPTGTDASERNNTQTLTHTQTHAHKHPLSVEQAACLELCPRGTGVLAKLVPRESDYRQGKQSKDRRRKRRSRGWMRDAK